MSCKYAGRGFRNEASVSFCLLLLVFGVMSYGKENDRGQTTAFDNGIRSSAFDRKCFAADLFPFFFTRSLAAFWRSSVYGAVSLKPKPPLLTSRVRQPFPSSSINRHSEGYFPAYSVNLFCVRCCRYRPRPFLSKPYQKWREKSEKP